MTSTLATTNNQSIERVLIQGDLSQLSESERVAYYTRLCESLGLNCLTQPFAYIKLNGKLKLYALREATEQLRRIHNVSVRITSRELVADSIYVVTAQASLPDGRCDESIGAVPVSNLQGEALANGFMKCETKAKRRVTLSICGLAFLDETEVDSIPTAAPQQSMALPSTPAVWRSWKSPIDALAWSATILPNLTDEELQRLFDEVPANNGKKAPAWVKKVLEMATVF